MNSDVEDSKFNILYCSLSKNEEPKDCIFDENIIGIEKNNEVDISHLNIEFPKEAFFTAIVWLIIESK